MESKEWKWNVSVTRHTLLFNLNLLIMSSYASVTTYSPNSKSHKTILKLDSSTSRPDAMQIGLAFSESNMPEAISWDMISSVVETKPATDNSPAEYMVTRPLTAALRVAQRKLELRQNSELMRT
jgi:hypothetical protein